MGTDDYISDDKYHFLNVFNHAKLGAFGGEQRARR